MEIIKDTKALTSNVLMVTIAQEMVSSPAVIKQQTFIVWSIASQFLRHFQGLPLLFFFIIENHTLYLSRKPREFSCKFFLAGVNFFWRV